MASIEFEFAGERREETGSRLFPDASSIKSTTCYLDLSRDALATTSAIAIDEQDVLEIETDDGSWLLSRHQFFILSNLDADGNSLDVNGERRDRDTEKRQLPTIVSIDQGKRGVVDWVLRALRVLDIDLAGLVVSKAAEKIDKSLSYNNQQGLYRLGRNGEMLQEPMDSGSEPVLLLVHGTASSTLGAFGELLPNAAGNDYQRRFWQQIHDAFEGRVYAFEHATLTEPVAKNVFDLLLTLPELDCPPLVILSHSRGGLVSDLLGSLRHSIQGSYALEQLPGKYTGADANYLAETEYLSQLSKTIRVRTSSGLPRIIRHVRVACPAAGTSLAGPNTNIYLTVIAKLLERVPDLPVVGIIFNLVEALLKLAAAIIKEGLAPGALPGIESMKPDGLLVNYLQTLKSSSGELVVVSGDSSGFVDKILLPIFWGPHDYVVDTVSMVEGFKYGSYQEYPLVGDGVSHTRYFGRKDVQEWLIDELQPTVNHDRLNYQNITDAPRGRLPEKDILASKDKTCIIFLPGFMGSELSCNGVFGSYDIWIDYLKLVFGKSDDLALENPDVFVSGVLEDVYADFIQYADQRLHVVPMAYDWRDTIESPVEELENLIKDRLESSTMPLSLICHSMGGLVARAWRQRYPATWQRVVARKGYMIQGGTPNLGTWQVPRIFSGEHELLNKLSRYDLENSRKDWQKLIAKFPGPTQMAVYDDSMLDSSKLNGVTIDLGKRDDWKALGAGAALPTAKMLTAAKNSAKKRREDKFQDDENIIYLAGIAHATPELALKDNRWCLINSSEGDGLALWKSAGKTPDYYINATHGNLFNDRDSFDSILDLALTGKTAGLSVSQPSTQSRGFSTSASALRMREGLKMGKTEGFVSTQAQILSAITHGGSAHSKRIPSTRTDRLEVEVIHGNLMFSQAPMLVGHYAGDQIIRAEAALDHHLGGVLRQRWQLGDGQYASEPGSKQVFMAKNPPAFGPAGAIVVGLGRMGELNQGDLILTVMRGLQSYLQTMTEAGLAARPLSIGTLLVGSGNEELGISEVLEGILRGVTLANDSFKARDGVGSAAVHKVQFIEWHFDLALDARWALDEIHNKGELNLTLKQGISNSDGGLRRLRRDSDNQWWTSLSIAFDKSESDTLPQDLEHLVFSVGGEKAMGLASEVKVSRREIERRLLSITKGGFNSSLQAQKTLFDQLIPPDFKRFAAQQRNLILELDPEVAYIPWELLVDRRSIGTQPVSVSAGMLRRIRPQNTMHHKFKPLADSRKVLVIGNPPASNTSYPYLPGATAEAEHVMNIISSSPRWDCTSLIYGKSADGLASEREIISEILTGDYQLLHVAAHGAYVEGSEDESGILIGEEPQADRTYIPLYFHPRHISSLRFVPSLVFLNCCHTGSVTQWQGLHHLTASLSAEFIKAGAKAVIAAAWAIDDQDALTFSTSFYRSLFSGKPFGEAVSIARRSIYKATSDTWAAFQCYGDPGFTLTGVQSTGSNSPRLFHRAEELVVELNNIESEMRGFNSRKQIPGERLRNKLEHMLAAANESQSMTSSQRWIDAPEVVCALALVYGELGDWDLAKTWLNKAMQVDGSKIPLSDLLRIRNYLIRFLEKQAHHLELEEPFDANQYALLLTQILDITQSMDSIVRLSPQSALIHEHRGGAWKLVAIMINTLSERKIKTSEKIETKDCLQFSRDAYMTAYRLKFSAQDTQAWYPGNNALLMEALLQEKASRNTSKHLKKEELDLLDRQLRELITSQSQHSNSTVWTMIAAQDFDFARWVLGLNTEKDTPKLVAQGYIDSIKNFGSAGQVDSVVKQLRCASKFATAKKAKEIQGMIGRIQREI